MSKINAVRLINLNYNNNAIKISDETFHMNGESTLLSLRNGGGKSVLVQMMTAPFVHKRYRDAKDRPFESYFTTAKPTFILVEWVLDRGAGYVLTGMMVRRSQSMEEGQRENLDMVNLISEYREPCAMDIHHLPVVEKGNKELTLKSFAACRQLFESCKKDSSCQFFYYDMTNSAQSRQYFEKLMEYQINFREWESIIKKVNLEESGLSSLFADCRDERGLVEKWFLEAVEGKLNKEKNRMREFQSIMGKYAGQYKDNQSKIRRRDTIRLFKEEGMRIEEKALQYLEAEGKKALAAKLMPGIRFSTSDTGVASAKVSALLMGLQYPIHIGGMVAVEHRRQSKVPDFVDDLDMLFAQFGDSVAQLSKLLTIHLDYPINAMTAVCKKLAMPKKAAIAAIAMFETVNGDNPASAHDVFIAMQEIPFNLKVSGAPENKLLSLQENMARALTLRWSDYDLAKKVSW